MKRSSIIALIVGLVFASSCKEERHAVYMTNQKAADYFTIVDSVCQEEKAQLWGMNLYGPLMMIDRETREIYANVQDAEGQLKPKDGIYVGTYPKEKVINNLAVEYGGTMFGMVRLRSEEDEFSIVSRSVHALFHCFQIKKGIDTPDYHTSHLDQRTARLWVKLEWRALQRAIRTSGETRTQAIRDALVFRSARREMYPGFIEQENYFENYEGTTTFTFFYLCTKDRKDYLGRLQSYYDRGYNANSFPGWWGFINGALYSHLLFESGFDFSSITTRDTDLGELTRVRYNIVLPEISRDIAGSLAFNYDMDLISQEENKREVRLREEFRRSVCKYVDRPVVFVELQSPNFSFEPGDMTPADTLGTIYNTLRVSDNWGKIDVDKGGCLVSPDLEYIRVPAKNITRERNHITGDGWEIILNESWELAEYDENFIIKKLLP